MEEGDGCWSGFVELEGGGTVMKVGEGGGVELGNDVSSGA